MSDAKVINDLLDAAETARQCEDVKWKCVLDKRDDLLPTAESAFQRADIKAVKAVRLWMAAGSPRVPDVPSDEALGASASVLDTIANDVERSGSVGREAADGHRAVATLLRSLRGA